MHRAAWLPVAAVLLGTGWGSQQFTPMLLVYHQTLGLTTGTLEALFGVYALGQIPGLLLGGPLSDVWGRRAVVVPAAALCLVASVVLAAAGHAVARCSPGASWWGSAPAPRSVPAPRGCAKLPGRHGARPAIRPSPGAPSSP